MKCRNKKKLKRWRDSLNAKTNGLEAEAIKAIKKAMGSK